MCRKKWFADMGETKTNLVISTSSHTDLTLPELKRRQEVRNPIKPLNDRLYLSLIFKDGLSYMWPQRKWSLLSVCFYSWQKTVKGFPLFFFLFLSHFRYCTATSSLEKMGWLFGTYRHENKITHSHAEAGPVLSWSNIFHIVHSETGAPQTQASEKKQ